MKHLSEFINEGYQISALSLDVEKIVTKLVDIIDNLRRLFGADGNLSEPNMGYWPKWIKETPRTVPAFFKKWAKGKLTDDWNEWVLKGLLIRSPWSENDLNIECLKNLTIILCDESHRDEPVGQLMIGIAHKIRAMVKRNEALVGTELENIFNTGL